MPRQTKSFLLERFREMGIRPATRHGQNFLIDLNLVQLIIDSAELTSDDVVLEVGTGTGSLTAMMAEQAAAVVTVEIDAHLFELASEQLIDLPNVTMLQARRAAQQEQLRRPRDGRRRRASGRRAGPAIQAGRQPALQHRHARALESAAGAARAALDDGHDPEGAGRPHHGRALDQGLQRAERVDSKPVHGRDRPPDAALGILAGAEGDVGHSADRRRSGAAGQNRRPAVLPPDHRRRCSCTAASFCGRTSWPP